MAIPNFTKDDYRKLVEDQIENPENPANARLIMAAIIELLLDKKVFTPEEFESKWKSVKKEAVDEAVNKVTDSELSNLGLMSLFGMTPKQDSPSADSPKEESDSDK